MSRTRRAATASLIGSALEWYDFFLYGTAAALVFGPLFFTGDDSLIGTIAAFGTFAIGFIARPFGGVIFGHFGDRLGRKSMLVITLMMMGVCTALIGLLPTHAQIGIWAPVLLVALRVVQGIAVGGEWGGAVLLISENAPPSRRGFFSAFSQVGVTLGFILSSSVFALVSLLPKDDFLSWGWRIPFLLGLLLMIAGLVIRMKVQETPVFEELQSEDAQVRYPALEAIKTQRKSILIAVGARMAENGGSYIFAVFSLAYGVHIGISSGVILTAIIGANILETFTMVGFAALSDRIGRRPVYLIGAVGVIVWALPFFLLLNTKSTPMIWLALVVAIAGCHGAMIGTQPSFFSELFTGKVRYSGLSIGHEVAAIFAGGVAPLIATALLAWSGTYWPIALYLACFGVLSTIAVIKAPETRGVDPVSGVDTVLDPPHPVQKVGEPA
ncbi:MAG: MFS transporter [Gordonia sp. (in: high G+C Gram-positive bacteria)]|uniref:MFS transporter n=1 Tax=Gordonia sp. (in: high G+C Gram-positive bacteria) TaxID=84139 RepID=UPI003C719364